MRFRRALIVALTMASGLAFAAARTGERGDPSQLAVHEWGTFTSVAGPDGQAVTWQPLSAASDLPCFVRRSRFFAKGAIAGTIRMETPVLYFYAPRDVRVDARVRF